MKPMKIPKINAKNLVDYMIAFESTNMTRAEFLALFSYLIKTGKVWSLQGMYGRQAENTIGAGLIDRKGNIHWDKIKSPEQKIYEE